MPTIQVNDVQLYYEFKGREDGPTVVFVNGLLTDTASWNRHLPYFVARYRCLVYDCRGQGQSDKPDHPYETRLHIADLTALVAALGVERAHFVGLSNGGAVVLAYAADHPERVASVVTCGAYAEVETILRVKLTSWIRAMEAGGATLRFDVATPWVWGGGYLENNYEGLLSFREKGVNMPITAATNLIKGAMVHDISDKLAHIAAPALIMVGEDDLLTPPKYSRAIAAAIPQAELLIMPGIGHAAALEDVAAFSQAVLTFFARVEAQETAEEPSSPPPNPERVSAGDLKINYIEQGAGEPIVFVHGNWGTAAWWEPALARLPQGYRGLAYDLRGRGKTEGPDNGYTMPEMAADLGAFLAALGLDAVHLVGHSLGSAVTMEFALAQPQRVKSLTVVAPAWVDGMPAAFNVPAGQQAIKADFALFGRSLKALAPLAPDDDYWRRLVAEGHEQRIAAALRNLPALVEWQPGDKLRAGGVRALVIHGTLDPLTGPTAARAAAALGARHIVLEGVGHSPNIEVPDRFVELLIEHIENRQEK